jgi:hypothetical protein
MARKSEYDVINDVIIVLWWRLLNPFWWGCRPFCLCVYILLKPHQKVLNGSHQKVGINVEKQPSLSISWLPFHV